MWEEFENACRCHDWTYKMGAGREYYEGTGAHSKLLAKARELAEIDDARVCEIWNRYAPQEIYGTVETFLPKRKLINIKSLERELFYVDAMLKRTPVGIYPYNGLKLRRERVLKRIEEARKHNLSIEKEKA
jgi:hypothetical protein